MKKTVLLTLTALLPFTAKANDCKKEFNIADSRFFQLMNNEDEFNPKKILNGLTHNICNQSVNILYSNCYKFVKEDPDSRVCLLVTDVGYFYISRDMLNTVNIVFSRLD